MKKALIAMLASVMLTGAAFAGGGKKAKKANKAIAAAKAECCTPVCDKSTCANMPCCK